MGNIIEFGFSSFFLAVFIGSFSYSANNINANILERKLMTNFEKVKLPFSVSFVGSTVLVATLFLYDSIPGKEIKGNLLIAFSLTLIILFIVLFILEIFYSKFKSKKFTFFITLNDNSEWRIVKMTNSNFLLLEQIDCERFKLIKDYNKLPIRIEENNIK